MVYSAILCYNILYNNIIWYIIKNMVYYDII